MPTPQAVLSKADAILKKYAPVDRTVYKRITSSSGGDPLIGRVTVEHTDTKFDPQPLVSRITVQQVGPRAQSEMIVGSSGLFVTGSYELLFSASAITVDDLKNAALSVVFKDSAGVEEVFRITDYMPTGFQGSDVMFTTYIESVKRS